VEQVVAVTESDMVEAAPPASAAKPAIEKASATKPEPKAALPKPAASKPEPKVDTKPAAKPAEPKPVERKPDPKPLPAKPDAKPAAKPAEHSADEGRFVVQIGAFAEVVSAREARLKVEGMGLKTYTQVIESATGRRIRVRVGPYTSKAEAEKAASRIKSGGLQAAVLLL
jgi:DedD protein